MVIRLCFVTRSILGVCVLFGSVCHVVCKWENCGAKIGPPARRIEHELKLCPNRLLPCPHTGCTEADSTVFHVSKTDAVRAPLDYEALLKQVSIDTRSH